MPDEELFQLAALHRLRDPEILRAQIHRMLLDPKSRALVENFGGQWLETRNLDSLQPIRQVPEFTNELRVTCSRKPGSFFNPSFEGRTDFRFSVPTTPLEPAPRRLLWNPERRRRAVPSRRSSA